MHGAYIVRIFTQVLILSNIIVLAKTIWAEFIQLPLQHKHYLAH